MNAVFHSGDCIRIIADHILYKGDEGTINRCVHDDVYVIGLDNGHTVVLKGDEMENIKKETK